MVWGEHSPFTVKLVSAAAGFKLPFTQDTEEGTASPFPELNLNFHGEDVGLGGRAWGGVGLPGERVGDGAAKEGSRARPAFGPRSQPSKPFASLIDTFQLFLPISLTFEMLFFFSLSER